MSDTRNDLPPPCPECAGATALKEVHRHHPTEKYIFFFKCAACEIELPRVVVDEQLDFAKSSNIRIPGAIKGRG